MAIRKYITAAAVAALALTACGSAEPLTQETVPTPADLNAAAIDFCRGVWSDPVYTQLSNCQLMFRTGANQAIEASVEHGATTFDADSEHMCLSDDCLAQLSSGLVEDGFPPEDVGLGLQLPYVMGAEFVEDFIAEQSR